MGMLKKRVQPEDVIINCSKDAKVPKPPEGRKWKEVRHDNSVSCVCQMYSNPYLDFFSYFEYCLRLLGWQVGSKTCKVK